VDDLGLGLAEPQAQWCQDVGDLCAQRFGVLAGAVDHHHEIVRVADQAVGPAATLADASASRVAAGRLPDLGEVLVEG